MRIAFYGSDAFSVPSLEGLVRAGHAVPLVITNPDRPRGRSGKPRPNPVKETAERLGAQVVQPAGRPGEPCAEAIQAAGCELGVVVAYGQFLGRRARRAPTLGYTINVHGSLLPRWRGAAPVAAAILHGDAVTGVTVQRLVAGMDAGPVLCGRETAIAAGETREVLRERLSRLGGEVLVEAVATIAAGQPTFTPQDEAQVTYAPLLEKRDGALDLTQPAHELERRVRAFYPWPGAYVELADASRLQVLEAEAREGQGPPGHVVALESEALVVGAGEGLLALRRVKPAGKQAMHARAFANGRRLQPGSALA